MSIPDSLLGNPSPPQPTDPTLQMLAAKILDRVDAILNREDDRIDAQIRTFGPRAATRPPVRVNVEDRARGMALLALGAQAAQIEIIQHEIEMLRSEYGLPSSPHPDRESPQG